MQSVWSGLRKQPGPVLKKGNLNKNKMSSDIRKKTIPFSPPDISESEIAEVCEALKSGWITTGPRTKLLERRLAAFIETGRNDIDCTEPGNTEKYSNRVVCLNSATAAEELNLRVLGIGPEDEVIVPAYTYTASASAALHCGAKVVFADIRKDGDPATHMPEMDYDALETAITPKTKAVIAVDFTGQVVRVKEIREICDEFGLDESDVDEDTLLDEFVGDEFEMQELVDAIENEFEVRLDTTPADDWSIKELAEAISETY